MHRHRSHTSGRATIGHDRARGSSDHGSNERGRVHDHAQRRPSVRASLPLQQRPLSQFCEALRSSKGLSRKKAPLSNALKIGLNYAERLQDGSYVAII